MKPEIDPEISQLIEVADQILLATSKEPLADHEKSILAHVLAGKPLKTARAGQYKTSTVVQQIAPKLWHRLGEGVRSKNVRLFLENAVTQHLLAPSPLEFNTGNHVETPAVSSAPSPQGMPRRIFHNLPPRQYSKFIGRQQEATRLLKLLSHKHPTHKICITGMGGMGKTSLALACAWRCLHASCTPEPPAHTPVFDLIIFVTAKQQFLDYSGLHRRRDPHYKDLVRQIINMLDRNELLASESSAASFEEQIALIYKVLEKYQTLLIVDNLEAVENQQDINDFLCDLPSSVKSIITTREGATGEPIRLTALSEEDGLHLVQQQAIHMGVKLSLENSKTVYQLTGGLPLAIHLAIGQLFKGHSIERLQDQLLQPTGNLAQHCLESSVQSIQHRPAYWLLLATALFPEPASRETLFAVAIPDSDPDISKDELEDELVHLQTLSLVNQENNPLESYSRYSIIAPTRAYILAQLKTQPQFEQTARERWLNWYIKFSKNYCYQNPTDWQGQFEGLDQEWENLEAVAKWSMEMERYAELLQLWQNLKPYFYMVGRGANGMRFWNTGLNWAKWLIDAASQRQDWSVSGSVMFFRAWVLIGTDNPNVLSAADELLKQAWELREYQNLKDQANIARQIGLLKIKQHQFTQAHGWLKQSDEILQSASLDENKRAECLGYTRYYQGWAYFDAGEIDAAKPYFEEAYQYAKSINLDRFRQVVETSLANIAVHQGELNLAKELLDKGLRIAEMNADRRRIASTKLALARLAHAEGNFTKKRRNATEALQLFEQLGMTTELKEVRALLGSDTAK
jgi:LuxR family glucitol operon transcriptional activator